MTLNNLTDEELLPFTYSIDNQHPCNTVTHEVIKRYQESVESGCSKPDTNEILGTIEEAKQYYTDEDILKPVVKKIADVLKCIDGIEQDIANIVRKIQNNTQNGINELDQLETLLDDE